MIGSIFSKTGSYDFVKAQARHSGRKLQQTGIKEALKHALGTLKRTLSSSSRGLFSLTENENFYLALYNEELLVKNTFSILAENSGKKCTKLWKIQLTNEYPVLNICLGFKTIELAPTKCAKMSTPNLLCRINRVRYGIDRVLYGRTEDEPNVYGVSTTVWLDVLEPAFDFLVDMKSTRRSNKGHLTKRRKKLRLRPGFTRFPLMGDSVLMHNNWGPMVMPEPGRMVQVFATRFAELGERNRRTRLVRMTDPVIPRNLSLNRNFNRSRSRYTMATPNAPRNSRESDSDDHDYDNNALMPVRAVNIRQFLYGFQARIRIQRLVFH